ncbi:GPI transamidase component gaa1 [Smittium mucronatum]|uniref:GPI transamidase component gaa1 n=1 Tax=Smittium mucronatum TaxID=133383 RepID=A0A1R0H236_9FUNG|nr:GPI transamidase component gaa1 [Smittium mucronatum]
MFWLCLFPIPEYSKNTYISENALLPAQQETTFGGESSYVQIRMSKLRSFIDNNDNRWADELMFILQEFGIEAEKSSSVLEEGYNSTTVHGIVRATRGDTVESVAYVTTTRTSCGKSNANGVELLLSLAKHFGDQNYWSKDFVFIFADKGEKGVYEWLRLQNMLNPKSVNHVHRVSGLQAAISVELPPSSSYTNFALYYEGKNGQLPNLDFPNIVREIFGYNRFSTFHHGTPDCDLSSDDIKGMIKRYLCISPGLLENMKWLAFGTTVGAHAPFLEAIESVSQSLNNLLEHFHQSFFLYFLPQNGKYISIGDYIIPVLLLVASLIIQGVHMWKIIYSSVYTEGNLTRFEANDLFYTTCMPLLKGSAISLVLFISVGVFFVDFESSFLYCIFQYINIIGTWPKSYDLSGKGSTSIEKSTTGEIKNADKSSKEIVLEEKKEDDSNGNSENKLNESKNTDSGSNGYRLLRKIFFSSLIVLFSPPIISIYLVPTLINLGCQRLDGCIGSKQALDLMFKMFMTHGSQAYVAFNLLYVPVHLSLIFIVSSF